MAENTLHAQRSSDHTADLLHGLSVVKRRVKLIDAASMGLLLLAAGFAYLLAVVLADHHVGGGLALTTRRALLLLGLAAWLFVLIWRGIAPLVKRINDLYAARLIERRYPDLQDSLVTALQLRADPSIHPGVVAGVTKRVASQITRLDCSRAVGWERTRRAGQVSALSAAIWLVYCIVAPKPVGPSLLRALGIDRPTPTGTVIRVLSPVEGESVIAGRETLFEVETRGDIPEEAHVDFTIDGGRTWIEGERMGLIRDEYASGRSVLWRATLNGRDVRASRDYCIVAGDARTPLRRLEVRPPPDVMEMELTLEPPSYTKLPIRRFPGGDVDALVGTRARLRVLTNVAARDARVVFDDGQTRSSRLCSIRDPAETTLEAVWTVDRDGWFHLAFNDAWGEPHQPVVRYRQTARPDRPPLIEIHGETAPTEGPPDEAWPLRTVIRDDFGITEVTLRYRVGAKRGRLALHARDDVARPSPRELDIESDLRAADFGAVAGDVIEYRIEAVDNRRNGAGEPHFQTGVSPWLVRRLNSPRPDDPAVRGERTRGQSSRRAVTPSGEDAKASRQPSQEDANQSASKANAPPGDSNEAKPDPIAEAGEVTSKPDEPTAETPAESAKTDDLDGFVKRHEEAIQKIEERFGEEAPDEKGSDQSGDEKREGSRAEEQATDPTTTEEQQRPADGRKESAESAQRDDDESGKESMPGEPTKTPDEQGSTEQTESGPQGEDTPGGAKASDSDGSQPNEGKRDEPGAQTPGQDARPTGEQSESGPRASGQNSEPSGEPTDFEAASTNDKGSEDGGANESSGEKPQGDNPDHQTEETSDKEPPPLTGPLNDTGRTARAVDEFERWLRRPPSEDDDLLDDLGWSREQAEQFVREYRRHQRGDAPSHVAVGGSKGGVAQGVPYEDGGDVEMGRFGDADIGGAAGHERREDRDRAPLREQPPERVPPDLRDLLDEYYRSMNLPQRTAVDDS
jgi:hypothetical protein